MQRGTVRGVGLLALLIALVAGLGCTARDDGEGGSLVVGIQPAAEVAWLVEDEVLVQLSPGGAVARWTPGSRAVFTGLRPGQRYQVHLPARFLAAPRGATALPDRPVKIMVAALTFSSLTDLLVLDEYRGIEKALYLDTTVAPDRWQLAWRQGHLLVARQEIPRDLAALPKSLVQQWKDHGNHQDKADRRMDQAVVVVADGADFDEVAPVVGAFAQVRRPVTIGGSRRRFDDRDAERSGRPMWVDEELRPAFMVRLAHRRHAAPPPPPPEPGPSGYEGPAPSVRVTITESGLRLALPDVQATVDRAKPRLRQCYEHGLVREPQLDGGLTLRLQVGLDGRSVPPEVSLDEPTGTLDDAWVVQCIADTFQALRFPERHAGGPSLRVEVELTPPGREPEPEGREAL